MSIITKLNPFSRYGYNNEKHYLVTDILRYFPWNKAPLLDCYTATYLVIAGSFSVSSKSYDNPDFFYSNTFMNADGMHSNNIHIKGLLDCIPFLDDTLVVLLDDTLNYATSHHLFTLTLTLTLTLPLLLLQILTLELARVCLNYTLTLIACLLFTVYFYFAHEEHNEQRLAPYIPSILIIEFIENAVDFLTLADPELNDDTKIMIRDSWLQEARIARLIYFVITNSHQNDLYGTDEASKAKCMYFIICLLIVDDRYLKRLFDNNGTRLNKRLIEAMLQTDNENRVYPTEVFANLSNLPSNFFTQSTDDLIEKLNHRTLVEFNYDLK